MDDRVKSFQVREHQIANVLSPRASTDTLAGDCAFGEEAGVQSHHVVPGGTEDGFHHRADVTVVSGHQHTLSGQHIGAPNVPTVSCG